MSKYCNHCMSPIEDDGEKCKICGSINSDKMDSHILKPGTIIHGKFYVGEVLGEGGFGITYIGRDLTLDMKVAIKEYYPNGYVNRSNTVSADIIKSTSKDRAEFFEKGLERFLAEARILAKFAGENGVVTVRDFFEENNTAYLIMEYVDGETLKEFLEKNGTILPEDAIKLMIPVLTSLMKVHEQGLIHRDISPDNIMITNNKEIKLLDFGAARTMSALENKSLSIVLKHGYAPFEQYQTKGKQGAWTDIYAICATLYKCITGTTPEDATGRIAGDDVKYPSALGINISKDLERVIMKGMSVQSADRYQNISELINALAGCVPGITMVTGVEISGTGNCVDDDNKETIYVSKAIPREEAVEKPTEKEEEKPAEKEVEKPVEKEEEKPVEKEEEKPVEKEEEKPVEKAEEKPAEKEEEKPVEKEEEKPVEKEKEKTVEKAEEKPAKKIKEKPEKKTKEKAIEKTGKKKSKLPLIIGIIVILLVAGVVLLTLPKKSSSSSNNAANTVTISNGELLFKNSDSMEWIEPEKTLKTDDVDKILSDVEFDETFFYGIHMEESFDKKLSTEEDKAVAKAFSSEVGFSREHKSEYGRYLTTLPYRIEAGPNSVGVVDKSLDLSKVMKLYYYDEDGRTVIIVAYYEVEDDEIVFERIFSESNKSGVTEEEFSYGYSFSMGDILLYNKEEGTDVKLVIKGYGKDSSSNISIAGRIQEDEEGVFETISLSLTKNGTSSATSRISITIDGKSMTDCIAKVKDGILTISYSDGHKQNAKITTEQYILFDCGSEGIILIDTSSNVINYLKQ